MKGIALHPSVLQMARAADVAWVRDELAYEWRAEQDVLADSAEVQTP